MNSVNSVRKTKKTQRKEDKAHTESAEYTEFQIKRNEIEKGSAGYYAKTLSISIQSR